jgi:hypothetical protein
VKLLTKIVRLATPFKTFAVLNILPYDIGSVPCVAYKETVPTDGVPITDATYDVTDILGDAQVIDDGTAVIEVIVDPCIILTEVDAEATDAHEFPP